jgi:deoxyribodipyrimidine photo-lyase
MKYNIFWFRRDLRLEDNAGLYHALKSNKPVIPVFIFDRNILDDLEDRSDARVNFLHDTLTSLQEKIRDLGSELQVYYGKPKEIYQNLLKQYSIDTIYTNHDFEPYAHDRDHEIKSLAEKNKTRFKTYKDHVIFEKGEVLKDDGLPYTVFTPYKRKWMKKLNSRGKGVKSYYFKSYPTLKYAANFYKEEKSKEIPSLKSMNFEPSDIEIPSSTVTRKLIKKYDEQRNFPAIQGTSRLGIHFRFGTISIREKARSAHNLNEVYLSELVWRDFYAQILAHFPHVVLHAFRAKYDKIKWRNSTKDFEKWCEGKTGYPIVDAGMRELNATGFMHNRVRMIAASFLTKHLLLDWRKGEAYFAQKLLDFDLASNNGGWQWASGSGTDAAPYFRIFNPYTQRQKFDKDYTYVKKWVPEYGTDQYPEPMVDHKEARERCLRVYKEGLADQ